MIEKRKMQRFAIAIPSIVWPQDDYSDRAALFLVSRDVSAAGAFFLTPTLLDVGTRVRVTMFLELDGSVQEKSSKAQAVISGTITRTEKEGIAVFFDKKFKLSPASSNSQMKEFFQKRSDNGSEKEARKR